MKLAIVLTTIVIMLIYSILFIIAFLADIREKAVEEFEQERQKRKKE